MDDVKKFLGSEEGVKLVMKIVEVSYPLFVKAVEECAGSAPAKRREVCREVARQLSPVMVSVGNMVAYPDAVKDGADVTRSAELQLVYGK